MIWTIHHSAGAGSQQSTSCGSGKAVQWPCRATAPRDEACRAGAARGQQSFYVPSDNLHDPAYGGLTPSDLIDIAVDNRLHFDSATAQGVVFHLVGALSEYGKLGALCIAPSRAGAQRYFNDTKAALDRETGSRAVATL